MAGLGLFGQKNVITATTPIAAAFNVCISRRKNGLFDLNHLPGEVSFFQFLTRFLYGEVASQSPQNTFLGVNVKLFILCVTLFFKRLEHFA